MYSEEEEDIAWNRSGATTSTVGVSVGVLGPSAVD